MGLIERIFGKKNIQDASQKIELLNDAGDGLFTLGEKLFRSDVIRACIRPKARAIGKLKPKHIRENLTECKINPDPWIRMLFDEPNQFMSGQMLQEKLTTQLELNNNAFAYIKRNEYGYPIEIYPIPCTKVEVLESKQGDILLKFTFRTGKVVTLPYEDIIHLRQDFNDNDIFGDSPYKALLPLLEMIDVVDDSVIEKTNSNNLIKWLLNFNEVLDQEEMERNADDFVTNYMKYTGEGVKVGFSQPSYDLEQVDSDSYVPEEERSIEAINRIYSFFNTNEKIVRSTYNEEEWNTYYEGVIDPLAIQFGNEYTRKFFNRRDRSNGNRIVFETSNLEFASLTTKLNLSAMVDRGSLTPNEWRTIMGLGPIIQGNTPIRKTDTEPIDQKQKDREWELEREREKKREEEREKRREECKAERERFRQECKEERDRCREECKEFCKEVWKLPEKEEKEK